jgi:general secretion pathway protein G
MENNIGPNPFPPPPRRVLGPTVLVVIFIAAIAGGAYLVWELVSGRTLSVPPPEPAPDVAAHDELAKFERQLQVFQKSVGRLPTAAEGLHALVQRPDGLSLDALWPKLRGEIPLDPWGRPYQYSEVPGAPGTYQVSSQGPDATNPADDIVVKLAPLPSATPATPAFRATR